MSKIDKKKAQIEAKRRMLFDEDSFFIRRARKPLFRESMRKEGPALASFGLTNEQIASVWGVHKGTLYRYFKKYPGLKSAMSTAKIRADASVVQSLRRRALGYNYVETTYKEIPVPQPNGTLVTKKYKEKEVHKSMAPDTLAIIWWLKNRDPANWRDRTDLDISGHIEDDRRLIIEIVPKDGNPESVKALAAQVAKGLEGTTPKALKGAIIDVEAEEVEDAPEG